MSKNVKIMIIVGIAALVIGLMIFFYKRKKKADALAAEAAKKEEKPASKPVSPVQKKVADMVASGQVSVAPAKGTTQSMSTN
jgi:LPXTG-motif cell wall-anchored protein